MIKFTGAFVLVLAFAVSAQAQSARGGAHFSVSPSRYSLGGGGGGGGLSSGGSHTLPHFATTRFAVRDASGSASDYIPSTFVTYTAALREGQAELAARPSPLGTAAHARITPPKESEKIDVVQDQNGKLAVQTN